MNVKNVIIGLSTGEFKVKCAKCSKKNKISERKLAILSISSFLQYGVSLAVSESSKGDSLVLKIKGTSGVEVLKGNTIKLKDVKKKWASYISDEFERCGGFHQKSIDLLTQALAISVADEKKPFRIIKSRVADIVDAISLNVSVLEDEGAQNDGEEIADNIHILSDVHIASFDTDGSSDAAEQEVTSENVDRTKDVIDKLVEGVWSGISSSNMISLDYKELFFTEVGKKLEGMENLENTNEVAKQVVSGISLVLVKAIKDNGLQMTEEQEKEALLAIEKKIGEDFLLKFEEIATLLINFLKVLDGVEL